MEKNPSKDRSDNQPCSDKNESSGAFDGIQTSNPKFRNSEEENASGLPHFLEENEKDEFSNSSSDQYPHSSETLNSSTPRKSFNLYQSPSEATSPSSIESPKTSETYLTSELYPDSPQISTISLTTTSTSSKRKTDPNEVLKGESEADRSDSFDNVQNPASTERNICEEDSDLDHTLAASIGNLSFSSADEKISTPNLENFEEGATGSVSNVFTQLTRHENLDISILHNKNKVQNIQHAVSTVDMPFFEPEQMGIEVNGDYCKITGPEIPREVESNVSNLSDADTYLDELSSIEEKLRKLSTEDAILSPDIHNEANTEQGDSSKHHKKSSKNNEHEENILEASNKNNLVYDTQKKQEIGTPIDSSSAVSTGLLTKLSANEEINGTDSKLVSITHSSPSDSIQIEPGEQKIDDSVCSFNLDEVNELQEVPIDGQDNLLETSFFDKLFEDVQKTQTKEAPSSTVDSVGSSDDCNNQKLSISEKDSHVQCPACKVKFSTVSDLCDHFLVCDELSSTRMMEKVGLQSSKLTNEYHNILSGIFPTAVSQEVDSNSGSDFVNVADDTVPLSSSLEQSTYRAPDNVPQIIRSPRVDTLVVTGVKMTGEISDTTVTTLYPADRCIFSTKESTQRTPANVFQKYLALSTVNQIEIQNKEGNIPETTNTPSFVCSSPVTGTDPHPELLEPQRSSLPTETEIKDTNEQEHPLESSSGVSNPISNAPNSLSGSLTAERAEGKNIPTDTLHSPQILTSYGTAIIVTSSITSTEQASGDNPQLEASYPADSSDTVKILIPNSCSSDENNTLHLNNPINLPHLNSSAEIVPVEPSNESGSEIVNGSTLSALCPPSNIICYFPSSPTNVQSITPNADEQMRLQATPSQNVSEYMSFVHENSSNLSNIQAIIPEMITSQNASTLYLLNIPISNQNSSPGECPQSCSSNLACQHDNSLNVPSIQIITPQFISSQQTPSAHPTVREFGSENAFSQLDGTYLMTEDGNYINISNIGTTIPPAISSDHDSTLHPETTIEQSDSVHESSSNQSNFETLREYVNAFPHRTIIRSEEAEIGLDSSADITATSENTLRNSSQNPASTYIPSIVVAATANMIERQLQETTAGTRESEILTSNSSLIPQSLSAMTFEQIEYCFRSYLLATHPSYQDAKSLLTTLPLSTVSAIYDNFLSETNVRTATSPNILLQETSVAPGEFERTKTSDLHASSTSPQENEIAGVFQSGISNNTISPNIHQQEIYAEKSQCNNSFTDSNSPISQQVNIPPQIFQGKTPSRVSNTPKTSIGPRKEIPDDEFQCGNTSNASDTPVKSTSSQEVPGRECDLVSSSPGQLSSSQNGPVSNAQNSPALQEIESIIIPVSPSIFSGTSTAASITSSHSESTAAGGAGAMLDALSHKSAALCEGTSESNCNNDENIIYVRDNWTQTDPEKCDLDSSDLPTGEEIYNFCQSINLSNYTTPESDGDSEIESPKKSKKRRYKSKKK